MASYTTSLRLIQPTTGEYPGTWGSEVNTSLTALVDKAVAGTTSITMTAANYTLTNANGVADEAKSMFLVLGGTPGASYAVIVPTASKLYFVTNNTGFAQTVKTLAQTTNLISVPNGASMTLRCNGTDVVVAQNYFGSLTLGAALPVASGGTGAVTLTGVLKGNGTSAFTASNVNLATEVTGTLPVANGGTGATSLTANNVILGNGTSAVQFVAPGTAGNVLASNGTTWVSIASAASTIDTALALLGNTRNQFFSATGTLTVPAGVTSIRAYAFGAGGAGSNGVAATRSGAGGGGGGCAYGDIAVTAGQTVNVTISGSSTTVAIGATTYLTGNAGSAGSTTTGGAGGTASKDVSVTNGGAFSGGAGGAGDTFTSGNQAAGGGGGASGSPVGIGGDGGSAAGVVDVSLAALSGGGGGGWGGKGGDGTTDLSGYEACMSTGGGVGGAGNSFVSGSGGAGGAGGATSGTRPGNGRTPVTAFTDPLLRPLNGFGGFGVHSVRIYSPSGSVFNSVVVPPGLGGGSAGFVPGSMGGGGASIVNVSSNTGSLFGGGSGGGSMNGNSPQSPVANTYAGGGGGGSAATASAANGSAGGAGAVLILW